VKVEFLKWVNSLALRVPKAFAEEIGASVGKPVNVEVRDGKLVVTANSNGDRLLAAKSRDYCPDAGDLV